jgi:glyceraldehyde 3-phosphate dehydrogenase
MKRAKIAINGFGRIGRSFFRAAFGDKYFDIVAVNDLSDTKTLAYLLKYDSVYGRYNKSVEAKDGHFEVDGKEIKVFTEKNPESLPWKDLGIDIVVESTGFFTNGDKANTHIVSGAKKVVITAPANGDVLTALIGVNDDRFSGEHPITCNASCTTNSVAPVLQILLENFGIKDAMLTTIHGYTATQKLVDGPDSKDMRRGRAAAANIVPSTTGASEAITKAIPALEGKFDADAIRVPIIAGSLSVITARLERIIFVEEINNIFKKAAEDKRWEKVLKVTEDPIVSTDVIGEPYGAIVDLSLTKVVGSDVAKIFSWYDNEAGYTATLLEHVKRVVESL